MCCADPFSALALPANKVGMEESNEIALAKKSCFSRLNIIGLILLGTL